jgi:hypothetical protein
MPGIQYIIVSTLWLAIGLVVVVDLVKVEQLAEESGCLLARYVDSVNYGHVDGNWAGLQNLTE